MVAFAMTEESSAALLKYAKTRFPPPSTYFPYLFGCFLGLHQFGDDESDRVAQFARKCGLLVVTADDDADDKQDSASRSA